MIVLLSFIFSTLLNCVIGKSFALVGYMPEWRHEGADFPRLAQHLTHLILFSLEVSPQGDLIGADRLPRKEILKEAQAAFKKEGSKLLVCFGGNGRSSGFSGTVRNENSRGQFVKNLVKLLDKYELDGVDYNWEYPGYSMGRGYMPEEEVLRDYEGLANLLKDTKKAFEGSSREVTVAYYPDGKQESLFIKTGVLEYTDLIHSMSYDQGGSNHSPKELAEKTIKLAKTAGLPLGKLCLGVPFYGRNNENGDWTTYEDIVQAVKLRDSQDKATIKKDGKKVKVGFNGRATLQWKTKLALDEGLGGLMIWEVGQDCRVKEVKRGPTAHVVTCPKGEESSLLAAISDTRNEFLAKVKEEL